MKYLNQEIENELKNHGAGLVRFVGISHLDERQNRQLPNAIIFALPLTAEYLKTVFNIPDYVQARIADNYNLYDDEYSQTFPLSLPCPSFRTCSSLLLRPPRPSSSFRIGNR